MVDVGGMYGFHHQHQRSACQTRYVAHPAVETR